MMTDHTKLTDAEIDRRVAVEVMGWEWHEVWKTWRYKDDPGRMAHLPDWSPTTRWDHAGEVLAEIERRGWYYTLTNRTAANGHPYGRCKIHMPIHGQLEMDADDPRLAICLAALAAVEGRDE